MIARLAEGHARRSDLLDQVRDCAGPCHLTRRCTDDDGRRCGSLLEEISQAILHSDAVGIIRAVEQLIMAGRDHRGLRSGCVPQPAGHPGDSRSIGSLLQITHGKHRRLSAMVQSADSTQPDCLIRSLSALHGELGEVDGQSYHAGNRHHAS